MLCISDIIFAQNCPKGNITRRQANITEAHSGRKCASPTEFFFCIPASPVPLSASAAGPVKYRKKAPGVKPGAFVVIDARESLAITCGT